MNQPMTWARCWRVIRYIQRNGIPSTIGLRKYLAAEIAMMDHWQKQRFYAECSSVFSQGVTT
jgi:hypothetical protein